LADNSDGGIGIRTSVAEEVTDRSVEIKDGSVGKALPRTQRQGQKALFSAAQLIGNAGSDDLRGIRVDRSLDPFIGLHP
jgi:hypothetical protein